ncbi:MAG: hydrogenase maturation nickel metallochaperone HypA [Syntrophomonadaceae bacterium]|nr:hydrogenase maturation nickel metallochaperone HypA [Syntrophomonadaceae bacterium]
MHELSIMEGVLNMVRESAGQNHINKIKSIKLVIGKLSTVLPDSLHFCFQALSSQEDLFDGAVLEIEERDAVIRCPECDKEYTVEDGFCFVCPDCEGINVAIISGREMYLDYYEGDDN